MTFEFENRKARTKNVRQFGRGDITGDFIILREVQKCVFMHKIDEICVGGGVYCLKLSGYRGGGGRGGGLGVLPSLGTPLSTATLKSK